MPKTATARKKKTTSRSSRTQPVTLRKGYDSREVEHKDKDVHIPLEGDIGDIARPDLDVEIVDGPNAMAKAEEEAFMREKVVIRIAESTDKNAENPVPIGVNGAMRYVWRGVETLIERMFVAKLAQSRVVGYRQDLTKTDPQEFNKLTMSQGQAYPFELMEDKNPRGRDWLRQVLSQG